MTDVPIKFRIPTGAIRTIDDWPGLFVRGDDCFYLQQALISVFGGDMKHPSVGYLKELLEVINTEVIQHGPKEDNPA